MKRKIREWSKRYLPAEFFAIIGALLGAGGVFFFTGNRILSAYIGTMGENIGYYWFILIREHKVNSKGKKQGMAKTIRNLLVEFGFSESLDSLVVRPFCLYIFPVLTNNYGIGIVVGKLAADMIFYISTITAYELRKKYLH